MLAGGIQADHDAKVVAHLQSEEGEQVLPQLALGGQGVLQGSQSAIELFVGEQAWDLRVGRLASADLHKAIPDPKGARFAEWACSSAWFALSQLR